MRHQRSGKKLGRDSAHRKALYSNLAGALIEHGRIQTTEAKAKAVKPFAEKMITLGKRGDLHARRQALAALRSNNVVHLLFADVAPRFAERPGGYTRIVRLGQRQGDAAEMVYLELVDFEPTPSALALSRCEALQGLFGDRLYVELQRHGMAAERLAEPGLIELAYARGIALVAANEPFFAARDDYEAHDALLCIAEGRLISEPERRHLTPEHRFKTRAEMMALFTDLPEALANSVAIAQRCNLTIPLGRNYLPDYPTPAGITIEAHLHAEFAAAVLQDVEQRVARAAAEAVAADAVGGAAEMDLDVVPVGKVPDDGAVALAVIAFERVERLVGEHHAEAEGVVRPVPLVDRDVPTRPGLLRQQREVQAAGPATDHAHLHGTTAVASISRRASSSIRPLTCTTAMVG